MTRVLRIGVLAAALVVAFLGAACEDDPAPKTLEEENERAEELARQAFADEDPVVIVAEAPTRTEEADSASFELTQAVTAGGVTSESTAEGSYDYSAGNLEMTVTADVPGTGTVEIEERFVDGTGYARFSGIPGAEDQWITFDVGTLEEPGGVGETLGVQQSPTGLLDLLFAADTAQDLGSEEIRGDEATMFAVAVDPSRFLGENGEPVDAQTVNESNDEQMLPRLSDEAVRRVVAVLGDPDPGFFGESFRLEASIDADGRVVRFFLADVGEDPVAGPVEAEVSVELFDFGVEVAPEVPPAGEQVAVGDFLAAP